MEVSGQLSWNQKFRPTTVELVCRQTVSPAVAHRHTLRIDHTVPEWAVTKTMSQQFCGAYMTVSYSEEGTEREWIQVELS